MGKIHTPEQIRSILKALRASKLTKTEFCRINKIPLPTLYSWLKKEKAQNKVEFIPVLSPALYQGKGIEESKESKEIVLQLKTGILVKFPSSFSPQWLSSLLRGLL